MVLVLASSFKCTYLSRERNLTVNDLDCTGHFLEMSLL